MSDTNGDVIYGRRCFDFECYAMWLLSHEGEVSNWIIVKGWWRVQSYGVGLYVMAFGLDGN